MITHSVGGSIINNKKNNNNQKIFNWLFVVLVTLTKTFEAEAEK